MFSCLLTFAALFANELLRQEQAKLNEARKISVVNVNPTNIRPHSDTPEIRKYKKRFNSEILCAALWGTSPFLSFQFLFSYTFLSQNVILTRLVFHLCGWSGVNLLVGTENGLMLLDRSGQGKVYNLITRRRFQQMDVLEGLNVLVTISGLSHYEVSHSWHFSVMYCSQMKFKSIFLSIMHFFAWWQLFVSFGNICHVLLTCQPCHSCFQGRKTSYVSTTCHGWETGYCTTIRRWRRNRAGSLLGIWKAVFTIKLVSHSSLLGLSEKYS